MSSSPAPTLDEITRAVSSAKRELPGLRLVAVFGSTARGTARADSDVDLAVLPGEVPWTLADELRFAEVVGRALGREVDLVRLDEATTLLRWQVAREGRPILVEAPHAWIRFVASEYGDFAPAAEQVAERFRQRFLMHTGRP